MARSFSVSGRLVVTLLRLVRGGDMYTVIKPLRADLSTPARGRRCRMDDCEYIRKRMTIHTPMKQRPQILIPSRVVGLGLDLAVEGDGSSEGPAKKLGSLGADPSWPRINGCFILAGFRIGRSSWKLRLCNVPYYLARRKGRFFV